MRLPNRMKITIEAGGRPTSQMFVTLKFVTSQKNPFNLVFGPSDVHGIIEVTKEQIITEAAKTRDLFLMDYADIESCWTGTLFVAPLNREAIRRALSAFKMFRRYTYPDNYEENLLPAEPPLARIPQVELRATVQCDSPEKVHIEAVAATAT